MNTLERANNTVYKYLQALKGGFHTTDHFDIYKVGNRVLLQRKNNRSNLGGVSLSYKPKYYIVDGRKLQKSFTGKHKQNNWIETTWHFANLGPLARVAQAAEIAKQANAKNKSIQNEANNVMILVPNSMNIDRKKQAILLHLERLNF